MLSLYKIVMVVTFLGATPTTEFNFREGYSGFERCVEQGLGFHGNAERASDIIEAAQLLGLKPTGFSLKCVEDVEGNKRWAERQKLNEQ